MSNEILQRFKKIVNELPDKIMIDKIKYIGVLSIYIEEGCWIG